MFKSINPALEEVQFVDSDESELKEFELIEDIGLLKWNEDQDDIETRQLRFDRFLEEVNRVCK